MVRTLSYGPETGLNPARIAGIAVALLIHVAAFLLLLIPATLPSMMQRVAEPKAEVILIPKKPVVVPIQAPAPTVPQVNKVERRPMPPQAPTAPTPIAINTPVLTEAAAEPAMPSDSMPTRSTIS